MTPEEQESQSSCFHNVSGASLSVQIKQEKLNGSSCHNPHKKTPTPVEQLMKIQCVINSEIVYWAPLKPDWFIKARHGCWENPSHHHYLNIMPAAINPIR